PPTTSARLASRASSTKRLLSRKIRRRLRIPSMPPPRTSRRRWPRTPRSFQPTAMRSPTRANRIATNPIPTSERAALKRVRTKRPAVSARPPADRIQKVLAEAGLGSRREIERWIADGRVSVDGRRASLGDRITGQERILINGRAVRLKRQTGAHRHIAYYKPAGEVTTRDDPEQRPTVFERLPRPPHGRWITIGRLDLNTSGLLLLTTDGELAHRLMHPRYAVSREYAVRLLGTPTDQQLRLLSEGVVLGDGP